MCSQDKDFVQCLFDGVSNAGDGAMASDMLLSDVKVFLFYCSAAAAILI